MTKTYWLLTALASLLFIIPSCDNTSTDMMRKITGKAGEIIIVIPKDTWEGPSGQVVKDVLQQPQLALPQEEPLFDMIDIPLAGFTNIFKSHRNIILVNIASSLDSASIELKKDVWSHPQALLDIKARSLDEFNELFKSNSDRIIAFFLKAERERQMTNCKKYHDRVVYNALEKNFNIELFVPPGYRVAKKTGDFMWIRYETQETSQGIMVYSFPYKSDSTFTSNYLVAKRDSLLKLYVPGPTKGSYMSTEKRVEPIFNIFHHNGNYASEMRGLWLVENDFMGGPLISISVLDASKQRVITVDGYVYAPRYDKRNYLRQVEGIIYTLKFPDQAKNDKINSQIKSGN